MTGYIRTEGSTGSYVRTQHVMGGKCEIMHLKQDYKLRIFAGQYYLFSVSKAPSSDTVIQLSETAAWIWTQTEKGLPKEEISLLMTEEFEVDLATARKAVDGFLELLLQRGMAESSDV